MCLLLLLRCSSDQIIRLEEELLMSIKNLNLLVLAEQNSFILEQDEKSMHWANKFINI